MNYTKMQCLVCNNPATHVRSTQFAGDHPYCKEHAEKESDFNENDSYTFWYEINPLIQAGEMMSDKGYKLGTQEGYEKFAKKRNYEWDEWRPSKDIV